MDVQSGESEQEEVMGEWNRWVGNGGTGTRMRLTKKLRELIPEIRWSITKRGIFYTGWWRWPSKSNDGWRASTAMTLNRDEAMKIWRLGSCDNFVGISERILYSMRSVFWASGERAYRMGVIWQDSVDVLNEIVSWSTIYFIYATTALIDRSNYC